MHERKELTAQLRTLLNGRFFTEAAMAIVNLGADPSIQNSMGNSLLHILSEEENNEDGCNDEAIEELVTKHKVDIDSLNSKGFTPLQSLINGRFLTESAMKLVRLGANPDTKDSLGDSLLTILLDKENNTEGKNNQAIKELKHLKHLKYRTQQTAKTGFFIFVLSLVRERTNNFAVEESSYFNRIPIDIVCHIISFLDFKSMGKTPGDGIQLTLAAFSRHQEINNIGSVSVFQRGNTFTFFKSVHSVCRDYKKLQSDLSAKQTLSYKDTLQGQKFTKASQEKLAEFSQQIAVPYWHQHASLYQIEANKKRLFNSIKKLEPYNKPEIQSQLKF